MAFDFPDSPSEGAVFAPANGPVYVYTGGVWRIGGQVGTATAEARNRIVNGAMQISQEWGNTLGGPVVSPSYYVADQWLVSGALTPGTASIQRVQVATPKGSKDRIRVTVGTAKAALAAGDYLQMVQYVEGVRVADFQWGTANAKPVVVRFGYKAPAGTYSVAMRTFNGSYSYINPFTVSAAEANTDIERVLTFPAPTAGTWNMDGNAGSFGLSFPIAMGTTYQGASGAWVAANLLGTSSSSNGMATAGAVYELFDVGLYLDPNATGVPPPWVMPDEADELAACRRYWCRYTNWYVTNAGQKVCFSSVMRVASASSGGGVGFSSAAYPEYTDIFQTTAAFQTLSFNSRM
jgi:hypothetical protein